MNIFLIFFWVYAAMIAMSFWESEAEGRNAWDKGKLVLRIKLGKYCISSYQIFIFFFMWPLLLTLPFIIYGWDIKLFGVLASAYFSGMVIEDFMWFVVNPAIKFKESFNPTFANYYPWIRVAKVEIPLMYVTGIIISILSWYFIWK